MSQQGGRNKRKSTILAILKVVSKVDKQRSAMWLYPETYQKMDRNIDVADCKNRSDFLEKAIDFYVGYLTSQHATTYLSKILLEAIAGTLKENEN
ncbi:MAG: hypothetical protein ACK5MV_03170 [Aminipila sp.]